MVLNCTHCRGSVELIDDNGITDPRNGDRWEEYECIACGHTFSKTLKA